MATPLRATILCGALLLPLLLLSRMGAADGDQPIEYNHKVHIEDVGFECAECHANVETQARAVIPATAQCGECHDDPEAESIELRKVAEYVSNGEEIPWKQVHIVPDHAYFSHRRHVALGQLDCAICHGEVAEMEEPFRAPFVTIDMDWCIECHEERAVSNDCYACHR